MSIWEDSCYIRKVKFGTKIVFFFSIFGLEFQKALVIFEITSPEFVHKFRVNKRRLILILLDQNHKNLLPCLNSAPSSLSKYKCSFERQKK